MSVKRVVVTGIGALTPIGNTLNEYWSALVKGTSGAGPITHFDAAKFKTQIACELKGFNVLDHLEKAEARKYDPFSHYAIVCTDEAIKDAGLDTDTSLNKDRVGVIWASGNGGFLTFQEQVSEFAKGDGTPRYNPFFIPKVLVDIASGIISMRNGYRGVNYTTISACASANTALIDALNYIRWGKADVIISGGSEAAITQAGIGGFNALKALSTRNDDPATASRPFDVDRDGFVMGEGAGALVLESLEHAQARGAKIYAEICGGGMSADAYHLTAIHPDGTGAKLGMQAALDDAGIQREEVDYVNMHATSTPLGDLGETKTIAAFFGDHVYNMNLGATKSMTGHLLGAAGAVEAIACIMALKNGIIPPTINTQTIDPGIPEGLNLTLGQAQQRDIQVAMSNTFGFGGHNAIVIMRKWN